MSASRPVRLSPSERDVVENALTAERETTSARVAALSEEFEAIVDASAMAVADDEHDPEGSTIGFERAQLASLLEQARARLRQLERAHERLTAGEYGTCETCGRPIAMERLAAQPAAQTCVECAEDGATNVLVRRPGLGN